MFGCWRICSHSKMSGQRHTPKVILLSNNRYVSSRRDGTHALSNNRATILPEDPISSSDARGSRLNNDHMCTMSQGRRSGPPGEQRSRPFCCRGRGPSAFVAPGNSSRSPGRLRGGRDGQLVQQGRAASGGAVGGRVHPALAKVMHVTVMEGGSWFCYGLFFPGDSFPFFCHGSSCFIDSRGRWYSCFSSISGRV